MDERDGHEHELVNLDQAATRFRNTIIAARNNGTSLDDIAEASDLTLDEVLRIIRDS